MLSFISFVPLCFVYISEGRKEACALLLKELEATVESLFSLTFDVRVGREDRALLCLSFFCSLQL